MHLLCDNLWAKRIVSASKRDYAQLLAERGREAWGIFKDDWYGLDVLYVRDHPECSFWRVLMQTPNPPAYLPFVPEAGLHHQLDHIRQFYSQPDLSWVIGRPYPYLNETDDDAFRRRCHAGPVENLDTTRRAGCSSIMRPPPSCCWLPKN